MITGRKTNRRTWITIKLGILLLGFLFVMIPTTGEAEGIDFNAKIVELKAKFPDGKYWNHVGSTADNSNGYTDTACSLHKSAEVDHVKGENGCTCNHFQNTKHGGTTTQCMGFAYKLGYDVFGDTTWTTCNNPSGTQIANIQVGDIVRYSCSKEYTTGHSVFVIGKSGNKITIGEANFSGACKIGWGREIDLGSSDYTVLYYEHADNYASVLGSGPVTQPSTEQPTTEQPTTEQPATEQPASEKKAPFTGWEKAADGIHYQYVKADVVQKKKWITINSKKYYVNKNGYRVTGLLKIGSNKYYFNKNGVLQKNKWVTYNGETYYIGSGGFALKSQWLYYGNVLVYVTTDGSMAKSEMVKINGKTYYFNSAGKRSKGFKKYNGKYYYTNSSGIIQKKKWITVGNKTYYIRKTGVRAQNILMKIGKYKYYFDEKGCLVKNKNFTYKGKTYKADKQGRSTVLKNEVASDTTTE